MRPFQQTLGRSIRCSIRARLLFSAGAPARTGMGAVIHVHEVGHAHVSVALGRREAAVSQQLLDRPQISTSVEQMGRKRMAKAVRTDFRLHTGAQLCLF